MGRGCEGGGGGSDRLEKRKKEGIPKVEETGRNREAFARLCNIPYLLDSSTTGLFLVFWLQRLFVGGACLSLWDSLKFITFVNEREQ